MKTTVKKLSATKAEFTIKLDKAEMTAKQRAAAEDLARKVSLPGFRRGKAPLALAIEQISQEQLMDETINRAVRETVFVAMREEGMAILTMPEVDMKKFVPEQEMEYTATVEIWPEVKLCDYKKLKARPTNLTATEKDVEDMIERIAKNYAESKPVAGKAKKGREVLIDFCGKLEGKPFEGGKAENYALELGSGTFIPGFEDGIIGKEAGEDFELKLTFPKKYQARKLAGKEVVFEIKLKEVREKVLPEINDDFAAKYSPFKTLKEMRADLLKQLTKQNERSIKEEFKDAMTLEIIEKSEIPAPESIVKEHFENAKKQEEMNAARRGMSLADYIAMGDEDERVWEKSLMEVATKRTQALIAMQEIAKKEQLAVSEKEFGQKITELKKTYGNSKEAVKMLERPEVKNDIRVRMLVDAAYDFLVAANWPKEKTVKAKK